MANSNKFGGFNLPTSSDFGFDKTGSNWGGDFLKLFNQAAGLYDQLSWGQEWKEKQREKWKTDEQDRYLTKSQDILNAITWDKNNEDSMRSAGHLLAEYGKNNTIDPLQAGWNENNSTIAQLYKTKFQQLHNDLEVWTETAEIRETLTNTHGPGNIFHPDNFVTHVNEHHTVVAGPDPTKMSTGQMIDDAIAWYDAELGKLVDLGSVSNHTIQVVEKRKAELTELKSYIGFGYDGQPGTVDDIITSHDYTRYTDGVTMKDKLNQLAMDRTSTESDLKQMYEKRAVYEYNRSSQVTYDSIEYNGMSGDEGYQALETDILAAEGTLSELNNNIDIVKSNVYGGDYQTNVGQQSLSALSSTQPQLTSGNYAKNTSTQSQVIVSHNNQYDMNAVGSYTSTSGQGYAYEVPQGNPDNVGLRSGLIRPTAANMSLSNADKKGNIFSVYKPEEVAELVAKGYLTMAEVTQYSKQWEWLNGEDKQKFYDSLDEWQTGLGMQPQYLRQANYTGTQWLNNNKDSINDDGLTLDEANTLNQITDMFEQKEYLEKLREEKSSPDFDKMIKPMLDKVNHYINTNQWANHSVNSSIDSFNTGTSLNQTQFTIPTTGNDKKDQLNNQISNIVNKYISTKPDDLGVIKNFVNFSEQERLDALNKAKEDKNQELIKLYTSIDKLIKQRMKIK